MLNNYTLRQSHFFSGFDRIFLALTVNPYVDRKVLKRPTDLVSMPAVTEYIKELFNKHPNKEINLKCEEDMLLPVVNSPRMGMCGYTGD